MCVSYKWYLFLCDLFLRTCAYTVYLYICVCTCMPNIFIKILPIPNLEFHLLLFFPGNHHLFNAVIYAGYAKMIEDLHFGVGFDFVSFSPSVHPAVVVILVSSSLAHSSPMPSLEGLAHCHESVACFCFLANVKW